MGKLEVIPIPNLKDAEMQAITDISAPRSNFSLHPTFLLSS